MRDYLNIGPVPYEEKCQSVGLLNYNPIRARKEARAYVHQLERLFPDGEFGIIQQDHEFGSYPEVVAYYHDEKTRKAAFDAEGNSPAFWDEEAKKELGL